MKKQEISFWLNWLDSVHDKEEKPYLNRFEILLVSYGFDQLL